MALLNRPTRLPCCASKLSWVSKPPSETKNTWRLLLSALREAMMRATMRSWADSGLAPVKLANGALPAGKPLSAAVILLSAEMARRVTLLYSFSSTWPLLAWRMVCMASRTALEP